MNNSPDELHNCCSFRIQLIKSSQSLTVMLVLKSLEMEVNHFKPAHFMIPEGKTPSFTAVISM